MSIINKMLQELDRRHARSAPPGQSLHPEVRAVRAARSTGEWFWRTVAALMLVAAAWTLWVVYQLQPRWLLRSHILACRSNSYPIPSLRARRSDMGSTLEGISIFTPESHVTAPRSAAGRD